MVLLKRKEITFIVPPHAVPADTPCWYIPETGEIFPAYESYLERLTFYNSRRFTDTISGETNLSFWEALEKERQGSQDIDADFPEALRAPILRRCQFSQISRLNDLVASLYQEFKDNILSGEQVQVQDVDSGAWLAGILKERATFHDRPEMTRYFVQLPNDSGSAPSVACVDRYHIQRKSRTFTKYNLQRFLRHTIHRDRYEGAPWVVKPRYAEECNLETRVPQHLTQEAITAERRLQMGLKKGRIDELPSSFMVKDFHVMPRPGAKPSKQELQYVHERFEGVKHNGQHVLQMRPAPNRKVSGGQGHEPKPVDGSPPIKYPVEDLLVEAKGKRLVRPPLRNFLDHPLFPTEEGLHDKERLEMDSMGPLLETWNTLTVFAEFFELDGFVFDDFVGAVCIASEKLPIELFYEVHCAVLNRLVDEDGKILSETLAKSSSDDESDSASEDDDSSQSQDLPNGTALDSDHDGDLEMKDAPSSTNDRQHRAMEMLSKINWVERLRDRRHQEGAWTLLMVGLLDRLSSHPNFKARCERILRHLAPLDKPATADTAYKQYMSMGINLRIEALEMPTVLVVETKPFKEHMESLVSQSTDTRKSKVSLQSSRKPLAAEIARLDQQAKLLRPDASSQNEETDAQVNGNVVQADNDEDKSDDQEDAEGPIADSDESQSASEEDEQPSVSRRISNRALDLKRKRALEEEEKQHKEDTKEATEYHKILQELDEKTAEIKDLEEQIEQYDKELRENSCHRTKLLGRDRYLNRYIWFERNGMPFEGDSRSTDYGYANGRLWVQGPDLMERTGILDMDRSDEKQYHAKFRMSIQERRNFEEGPMQLYNANQWAYYDDPEEFENLFDWLNPKGEREKALKKELAAWRSPILAQMRKLKKHLRDVEEEHARLEDRPVGIATRKKLTVDLHAARYPCLKWSNDVAYEKYEQLLCMGPPPKRVRKNRAKAAVEPRGREASAPPEKRTTRQGTKFAR